ncbi:PilZ domain-containing protein, partial [Paracraurococcus ruber]
AATLRRLAAGETALAIPGRARRDEIGALAAALEQVRAGLQERQRLEAAGEAALEQRQAEFGRTSAGLLARLAEAAATLRDAAGPGPDGPDAANCPALQAAEAVARECATLRAEMEALAGGPATEEGNRRRFERQEVPGQALAMLRLADGRSIPAVLKDISAGGVGFACNIPIAPGTAVLVTLPGAAAAVTARVARVEAGLLGLVFTEPQSAALAVGPLFEELSLAA